jgi:hypothetical protein
VALNCTIRKVSENTIPVSASMPEATEEQIAIAADTLMEDTRSGRKRFSKRGKVSATTRVAAA